MRVIDADALRYEPLQKGDRNYRTYNLDDAYEDGYSDAFVDIRNAPTIDAVEVVRCEDCRYFKGDGLECHWGMFAYEDDYCSNGKRIEDADQGHEG